MLVPFKFSFTMFFFACSIAFRIAMGTSRALPIPNPAFPCWSPTTTSAEQLRFLPPFTTLVTRLMATTWSFRLAWFASTGRRTDSVSFSSCFDIGLEFQSCLSGGVGKCLHAAVISVTPAVEYHLLDSRFDRSSRNRFPHHFCRRHVPAALDSRTHVLVERACRRQRSSRAVVHHLRPDVPQRPEHAQPRPFRRSFERLPHPRVNPLAMRAARQSPYWYRCHPRSPRSLSGRLRRAGLACLLLQTLPGDAHALLLVRIGRA